MFALLRIFSLSLPLPFPPPPPPPPSTPQEKRPFLDDDGLWRGEGVELGWAPNQYRLRGLSGVRIVI